MTDDAKRPDETFSEWLARGQAEVAGQYPNGKLTADDKGALKIAIASDKNLGTVVMVFPEPVAWIGLPPLETRELAKLLLEHAKNIDGEDWQVQRMEDDHRIQTAATTLADLLLERLPDLAEVVAEGAPIEEILSTILRLVDEAIRDEDPAK